MREMKTLMKTLMKTSMNKGLTIIELLGVIIILGILSTVAALAIMKTKKEQDKINYENMIIEIFAGAKNYFSENGTNSVEVSKLNSKGYVSVNNNTLLNSSVVIEQCPDTPLKSVVYIEIDTNTHYNNCGCQGQDGTEILNNTKSKLCSGTNGTDYLKEMPEIPSN